jgi:uncharacterized repeat protein (TIGR03806 family)
MVVSTRHTARLILTLALLGASGARAEPPAPSRVPWTTSRFVGTPDPPPPYVTEIAFPALKFEHPVLLVSARGTGRLFVGEQGGKVYSFPNDPAVARADLAIDLGRRPTGMSALYGLAFHPKFLENRFVYLCYVTRDGKPDGTRVSRFTVSRDDTPHIDPDSERVVLTFPSGGHNGGCLVFGPEGYLYISTGDAEVPSPPDPRDTGQDVSDLLSSILRIDVDHDEGGRAYAVPHDNPFVKLPGARPEIWAYGFRNPWKMSFDPKTGSLWVGDVGWELWELVFRVVKGGNYGWSIVEGHQPVHPNGKRGPTPILPPIVEHPHSEAASVTGGYVYHGSRLPTLKNVYIYGDFQSGKLWGLRMDGDRIAWRGPLADSALQLVSFGEDEAGELFLLDYERTRQIHRLVPNPAANGTNATWPRKLSETGLFSSTRKQTPAPGVLAYYINASLWNDGATAERWLAVPGVAKIDAVNDGIWRLPDGSVLARTVSIDHDPVRRANRMRIETQILHREAGSWRPYSYVWNDEGTDAALAPAEGLTKTWIVDDPDAPIGRRWENYRVHARAECVLCHNPWVEMKTTSYGRQSASPLGLTTGQLNRETGGSTSNQLLTFSHLDIFAKSLDPARLPRTADPYDPKSSLDRRARAYLQVNCAHCHMLNAGGSATIQLGESIPLDRTQTLGVRPTQGTFGIDDARIIQPGDPAGSVLFYRMAETGGGRMPRIGSSNVDREAMAMIADWIASLGPHAPRALAAAERVKTLRKGTPRAELTPTIQNLLSHTSDALTLVNALFRHDLAYPFNMDVIELGSTHEKPEIRDLFESFLPPFRRVARLGESFDPKTVLNLAGDAKRGRDLFLNNPAAQCKSCHRLDGQGTEVGPDLAGVGAKYPRAELLRHLVEPSLFIDPKFASFVVETKSGQVFTGLLASKSEKELVLKDATGKATRVPADQVEQTILQPRSLMPALLLRDLTAQQAADLLEYMGTLRQAAPR